MKKIVLFVVFFVPFIVLAQNEAPKVSLSYDGKTTFLDQYVSSEGDTLSKIGMFAANIVSGEYFFGYNDFQVGVLGEFKNSQTLITRSEARSFNNLKFGIISRYNFNLGELKLGGGYFRDCQKNFGILGQDFFEYNTTKPGIFISGGVVWGSRLDCFQDWKPYLVKNSVLLPNRRLNILKFRELMYLWICL